MPQTVVDSNELTEALDPQVSTTFLHKSICNALNVDTENNLVSHVILGYLTNPHSENKKIFDGDSVFFIPDPDELPIAGIISDCINQDSNSLVVFTILCYYSTEFMHELIRKVLNYTKGYMDRQNICNLDMSILLDSIKLSPDEDFLDPFPYGDYPRSQIKLTCKVWNGTLFVFLKLSIEGFEDTHCVYTTIVNTSANGVTNVFNVSGCSSIRVGYEDFGHMRYYSDLIQLVCKKINWGSMIFHKIPSSELMRFIDIDIYETDHRYLRRAFGHEDEKYVMLICSEKDLGHTSNDSKLSHIQNFIIWAVDNEMPFDDMRYELQLLLMTPASSYD